MAAASSTGCLPMSLWCIENRHRITKLFLNGPCGFQRGEYPDPYKQRLTEIKDVLPSKEEVDKNVYRRKNYIHGFADFSKLPRDQLAKVMLRRAKDLFPLVRKSEEFLQGYIDYNTENFLNLSQLGVASVSVYRWPLFTHPGRSFCSPERFLNWQAFPICISFGDRDFLGSEGADLIIKTNKFFATGEA